jgi:two-component system phosphate regulon sensor histidine kinase PhoR
MAANSSEDYCKKYVDGITRETGRMMALVGDMLKLSELDEINSAKTLNPVDVSLVKVVEEVLNTLSSLISKKRLKIEIIGGATIKAERNHVYDVVKNIIENAVRYSNTSDKVSINISNSANRVNLLVADDGIGIQQEEQTRIFERFYRVDKSRSQTNGGTGLGLAIVKNICTMYDWKLSLRSKVGAGTEVSVEFNTK